jgi:hypothetical protein
MYGSGVRAQVFEVIVRQALAGAPWREICAGPMLVNNISPEEILAEVDRRLNILQKEMSEKEQALFTVCLDEWKERLKPSGSNHYFGQDAVKSPAIEALVSEFYSAYGLCPPKDIVICKSPLTVEFYWRCANLSSSASLGDCLEVARSLARDTVAEWLAETSRIAEKEFPAFLARNHGREDIVSVIWACNSRLTRELIGAIDSATDQGFGSAVIYSLSANLSPQLRPLSTAVSMTLNTFDHVYVDEQQTTSELNRQRRRLDLSAIWNMDLVVAFDFIQSAFKDRYRLRDEDSRRLKAWLKLFKVAPWYLFFEHVCYVGCAPTEIVQDERRRISSRNGAAVVFPDGCKIWAVDGIHASRKLIEEPSALTAEEIDTEPNSNLRRLMLDIYGVSRFLMDTNAKLIQEDECGQLYRKDMANDEALVVVRVTNKTMEADGTYAQYFLRVPPTITTAKEAVAWTFQLPVNEYDPFEET